MRIPTPYTLIFPGASKNTFKVGYEVTIPGQPNVRNSGGVVKPMRRRQRDSIVMVELAGVGRRKFEPIYQY